MTYTDTKLLLRLGDDFRANNNSLKDVNEMKAHDVAIHLIREWAQDKDHQLSEKAIRELNQLILVKDYWAEATTRDGQATRRKIKVGTYKEQPNHVQLKSGEIFRYAEPNEVPAKMEELIKWYREQKNENVLETAAFFHYKFVIIHPFDDGNGRISRLLMNYHLLKNGYPPIIIKSQDKSNYLYALNQADAGNEGAFVTYLGDELKWSLELSIKAAKGQSIEEQDDIYKEVELWKKKAKGKIEERPAKSIELVTKLFNESIKPLAQSIEKAAEAFDDVYELSSFNISYKTKRQSPDIPIDLGEDFDENYSVERISAFVITKILHGPKIESNSIAGQDLTCEIEAIEYIITFRSGTKRIRKSYLEKVDVAELTAQFMKHLYNQVRDL